MMRVKHQKGLILIELIMTIVLIGIIATFTGFFIYSGINGYIRAKYITNGALDAQRALDRISLELRDITDIDATPAPSSSRLEYQSAVLTGTRVIEHIGTTLFIRVEPNPNALLENVTAFSLAYQTDDLDANAGDEVAYIDVAFKIDEIGTEFKTRIFPRNLVTKTW